MGNITIKIEISPFKYDVIFHHKRDKDRLGYVDENRNIHLFLDEIQYHKISLLSVLFHEVGHAVYQSFPSHITEKSYNASGAYADAFELAYEYYNKIKGVYREYKKILKERKNKEKK